MGIEKRVYSFRFDPEMVARLQLRAEEENRSLSNLVETILKQYLAKLEFPGACLSLGAQKPPLVEKGATKAPGGAILGIREEADA